MRNERKRGPRRREAFTLMEVLLVLVILVILAALATTTFTGIRAKSKRDAAKAQVGLVESAADYFQLHMNRYPNALEELLQKPSETSPGGEWTGPYLKKEVGLDPWGNPYNYVAPGSRNQDSYDFWSSGPDGQSGTADDIGNWETQVQ